ncbi:hypothetical protein GCM10010435_02350 [Winogradskya consettensis]|uniref:Uncharacterized protein n=1 Tax=Winogradskya consettensis TaxID=113560 RepID=A0A919VK28_9ACTN|nr:hypothetical protein [Actinoplanes consettensis]GIM66136.1 hypothetical protein Aco04nite_00600 [Actinoplanes consettensis]
MPAVAAVAALVLARRAVAVAGDQLASAARLVAAVRDGDLTGVPALGQTLGGLGSAVELLMIAGQEMTPSGDTVASIPP